MTNPVCFLIASDLHGAMEPTEALLAAYEREKKERPTRLLLLGDLLYHGPRNDLPLTYAPKQVIERLNVYKNEIFCVRGNCDTEVDQMVLQFPLLADYALVPMGSRLLFATHGHHYHEDRLPPLREGDILLCGHTHIPAFVRHNEGSFSYTYLNPGSVSIPKGGSTAGYLLLDPCKMCVTYKSLAGQILWQETL